MVKKRTYAGIGAAVIAALFLLASCGAGVSVEEAEEIRNEIEDVSSRISQIEGNLADLQDADEDEIAETADAAVGDVIQELSQIASQLDGIEEQLDIPEPVEEEPMDPGADTGQPEGGF